LDQLKNALDSANTKFGRRWAILIQACNFQFCEYHQKLPDERRLVPWGPPGQSKNVFHARPDSITIDWMLRHMAESDTPPERI
jgi:hypothetical protein